MPEPIKVSVTPYHTSRVTMVENSDGKSVAAIELWSGDSGGYDYSNITYIDRATAARLIRQLQKSLDDSYNEMINERAGGSDDYV